MPKFSIVVPVFNHPAYTKACIDSVLANIDKNEVEVIAADNGSLPSTSSILAEMPIKIIRNEENRGIATALNQGIKAALGEYIVMLHNDCVLNSTFMSAIQEIAPALDGGEIKIASPFCNYSDEGTFVSSLDLIQNFTSMKPCNKDRPTIEDVLSIIKRLYDPFGGIDAYAKEIRKKQLLTRVDEVSSFCMISPKKVLMDAGLFDERYKYRGFEEKDLLVKLHLMGFDGGRANFFVHHFGNITSDGPGFNVHELKELNSKLFSENQSSYVLESLSPWTAVLFPDLDPTLTKRAKENLKHLNHPPIQIVEIPYPGIFPISKAWAWALPQVHCKFLGLIDADMLLRKDAPERMLLELSKPGMGLSAALLEDPCFGKLGHLVFWRTEVLKSVNSRANIPLTNTETFYLNQMQVDGWSPGWINEVLGDHAIPLDPWRVFRAYFRRGLKQRLRGSGTAAAVSEIAPSMKKGPWGHVALIGFHAGVALEYLKDFHDPDFDKFALEHYQKIQPFCEAIVAEELAATKVADPYDNRIKVAMICDCLEIGGMEIIVALMDKLIDQSKFKLYIYSRTGGPLEPTLRSEVRIAKQVRDVAVKEITCWLQYDKIDVALLMSFPRADEIFAHGKPCRVVERMDGIAPYATTEGVVDLAVYESEDIRNYIKNYPCKDYCIIPNGREPFKKNDQIRYEFRSTIQAHDKVVIANVARIAKIKNQKLLIDAAEILVNEDCKNFKLVIMGPNMEGLRAELETEVAKRNLKDYVMFINGDLEGPNRLWNAADICVNSSFTEGLSGSLVEAATVGLPIVATDVGATRDIVTAENGRLVPSEDATAFASALKHFITNTEERKRAGEKSLEISQRYSAQSMIDQFESLITKQAAIRRREIADQPLITILMPIWNRPDYLDEAIQSVLRQTDGQWRMLISIDDLDPKQEIMEIINRYQDPRISYVKWPHKNHCSAMNKALKVIKTDFMLRLDSDDMLAPEAIEILNRTIRTNPEIGWVYGSRTIINNKKEKILIQEAEDFSPKRLEEYYITRLLCMRISEVAKAGGFAEDMYYGEDYLMALTMMLNGTKFLAIKDNLYTYRLHQSPGISNSMSTKEHLVYIELLRQRYQKMKNSKGISWYGEDPSTMAARDTR